MTTQKPIRILMGSLKHTTAGKHSAFMPVAIGFIAAYARQQLGENAIDVKLLEDPAAFIDAIDEWRPDVIGVSHYCWNAEVNYIALRHAKKVLPDPLCIAGGPEFHENRDDCLAMLKDHPEIDFFAYGEGETPFALAVEKRMAGETVAEMKKAPQAGFMAVHPKTGELVVGDRPIRDKEMDFIPSPYLSGVMDHFFDGDHAPMVQLARGCPYACTFCNAAQSWYNRVAAFSMDRVRAELDYIAEKTQDYPNLPLAITDSNFGMFKRDVEIAEHIRDLQDKYSWPVSFDFTTGKAHHDRILHVNETMRNTAHILLALQSTNPDTLDVIKRKNLPNDKFREIHREIKRRGMLSATDLIIPLPEETKESFIEGLKMVSDEKVDLIVSNTLCLLKGTELNDRETRTKYNMETKWRMVPRQYGEYAGEKCFDLEEVCIATNTMPFEDYVECRGIGGVAIVFSDPQFDIIHRHVNELGISKFNVLLRIWKKLADGGSDVSRLFNTFIEQTQTELFDSAESAYAFYARPENYARLQTGEIGDNLIRRFRGGIFIEMAEAAFDLAYDCLKEEAAGTASADELDALDAAQAWVRVVRNVSPIFSRDDVTAQTTTLELEYDVQAWYEARDAAQHLTAYRRPTAYEVTPDRSRIKRILDPGYRMYGTEKSLTIPRILEYYDISNFWLDCLAVDQSRREPAKV